MLRDWIERRAAAGVCAEVWSVFEIDLESNRVNAHNMRDEGHNVAARIIEPQQSGLTKHKYITGCVALALWRDESRQFS